MFGISWPEFFVIVLVAVLVIPSRQWPDVARALATVVRFIRNLIWKITDASEKIKTQIDLERPIDELIKTTTDDILADFSKPRKPRSSAHSAKTKQIKSTKKVGRKK